MTTIFQALSIGFEYFCSKWILQAAETNKRLATHGNNKILSIASSYWHWFFSDVAAISKSITSGSQIESKFKSTKDEETSNWQYNWVVHADVRGTFFLMLECWCYFSRAQSGLRVDYLIDLWTLVIHKLARWQALFPARLARNYYYFLLHLFHSLRKKKSTIWR